VENIPAAISTTSGLATLASAPSWQRHETHGRDKHIEMKNLSPAPTEPTKTVAAAGTATRESSTKSMPRAPEEQLSYYQKAKERPSGEGYTVVNETSVKLQFPPDSMGSVVKRHFSGALCPTRPVSQSGGITSPLSGHNLHKPGSAASPQAYGFRTDRKSANTTSSSLEANEQTTGKYRSVVHVQGSKPFSTSSQSKTVKSYPASTTAENRL
jgi:hypothetical protein